MNNYEKEMLESNNLLYMFFIRFKACIVNIWHSPLTGIITMITICIVNLCAQIICNIIANQNEFITLARCFVVAAIAILISIIILWIFCGGLKARLLTYKFMRIGFTNAACETPIFLWAIHKDNVYEYVFMSRGITFEEWQKHIPELENILNVSIVHFTTGKKASEIHMHFCKGQFNYKQDIAWDSALLTNDATLCVGRSVLMPIYLDLNANAHILIGGATGSGKTWLLKHLLWQCIQKDYKVIIADYKGGIDYPQIWHSKCDFVTTDNELIIKLNGLINELEARKQKFLEVGANNIDSYCNYEHMTRIVFSCDELAEMLDVTGLSKEEKESKKKIEKAISTIARLGRAFGIHLVLATQRPDADVLNGQIKNNITCRICGKADDVLSKIILDSTDAASRVPKDAQGVFLNDEGILFKGYCFSDAEI